MKPNGNFNLTWEDVRAEIEALPKQNKKPNVLDSLTEEQRIILVKARDSGAQWCEVVKWWHDKGYVGTETTLLKCYRELKKLGY